MPLYSLAVLMTKIEGSSLTYGVINGYTVAASADAAKGAFVTKAMTEKPGFGITEVACAEIPRHVIADAAREAGIVR